jgi:AraC-like DNA-binding protein
MESCKKRVERYAAEKGFAEQSYLLDCVRKGLSGKIEALLSSKEYVDQMEKMFGNDLPFAKRSFAFIWPKVVYVASENGFSELSVPDSYEKYYQNLQRSTSLRSILELNKRFFVEYAEKVAFSVAESRLSPLVRRIHRYIDSHINDKITVSHIAQKLGFSRSHLAHVYKLETEKTITEEIHHRKILEAKRLIQYTSLSLTDIGSRLGFCSQSHFINVFRKETGITPLHYAGTCQENPRRRKKIMQA